MHHPVLTRPQKHMVMCTRDVDRLGKSTRGSACEKLLLISEHVCSCCYDVSILSKDTALDL